MKCLPIISLICCLIVGCQQKPITETEARKAATQLFLDDCKSFNRNSSSFSGPEVSGPNKTADGGFWYSYEWKYKQGEWVTIITVRSNGDMNISR